MNFKLNMSLLFFLILISYFLIWAAENLPALKQAWWSTDDYAIIEGLKNKSIKTFSRTPTGRPILKFWFATFLTESGKDRDSYNVLFRFIQGLIHCLTATVAAILIWKNTNLVMAFVSVLPFVLWPFNGEAVLWRSAGGYPIAALFGLLGVYAISQSEEKKYLKLSVGAICIIIATLTNQVASLSGLLIWFIVSSQRMLKCNSSILNHSQRKMLISSTMLIGALYIVGGLISYFFAIYSSSDSRAEFATNLLGKIFYLGKLNYLFLLSPENYPLWLIVGLTLLFVIYGIVIFKRAIKNEFSARDFLVYLLLPVLLMITPYAPLLLVSENQMSPRIMYLSPFLITGTWILLSQCLGNNNWARILVFGILTLIIAGYIKIAWINSSEYVITFKKDLNVLQRIKTHPSIKESPDNSLVFVATPPNFLRHWNPHKIKYANADSKHSAFLRSWSAHPFIRLFSSLKTSENERVRDACLGYCNETKEGETFQLFKLQNSDIICVCP